MRHRHVVAALIALIALNLAVLAPGQESTPAAPTEELTWQQLVARPELWPHHCTVVSAMQFADCKLSIGNEVPIVKLQGDRVVMVLPDASFGIDSHRNTDLLQVAKAAFAALSPAQRALDTTMLRQRADLWPSKVTMTATMTTQNGAEYSKGTELHFGTFDGTWIRARHPRHEMTPALTLPQTDFVERVRRALDEKVRPSGHRVLADLKGKLVHARSGKPAHLDAKRPPEFLVLYFSASWCGPCQQFSPMLRAFYERHAQDAGKRFEVVWISRDRSEVEMKAYEADHEFPWLRVAWHELGDIPVTQAHASFGIPDLVLLDDQGALLADSYVGQEYAGPESVLEVLRKRLASKPRRK